MLFWVVDLDGNVPNAGLSCRGAALDDVGDALWMSTVPAI